MATDRREELLAKIVEVIEGVDGLNVYRNRLDFPEGKMPAAIIFDMDEDVDEASFGRGRPADKAPLKVRLVPEIYLYLGASPDQVGTKINEWRVKILKAILTSSDLLALTVDGDIRYLGGATGLSRGRNVTAEAAFAFSFAYMLKPGDL